MPRGYRKDGTKIIPGKKSGAESPPDSKAVEPQNSKPEKPQPRQTHVQTRSFSLAMASLDRENFHYVKVAHIAERDEPLHFDEFMDKPSPSEPTRCMYEVVTMGETPEGRRLVGSSKMALLRCTKVDKDIEDKAKVDASGHGETVKASGLRNDSGQFEEFEEFQGGNFAGFKVAA